MKEGTSMSPLKQQTRKKQSLLNGALVLMIAAVFVKVIGVLYKIPLNQILGVLGRSYYSSAYAVFIMVYYVALAGLPTAMSRLVAHYMALGQYRHVRQTLRVARKLFICTGIGGSILLAAVAYPYVASFDKKEAFYSILALVPCVFLCCIMSTYRGYYNGLRNMTPTAVSEVIEAIGRMIIGVVLARLVDNYGMAQYAETGSVFGVACENVKKAHEAIYPYSSAAAVFGVTLSTLLAFLYVWARYRLRGDGITEAELKASPEPIRQKTLAKDLMRIAFPIVMSTLIFNLTNLIDAWTIQFRLAGIAKTHVDVLQELYGASLQAGGVSFEKIPDYLYGAYEIASDFRNLLPALTVTLGVSAIPVLSEAWTVKNHDAIKFSIESVIRTSMIVAMPLGVIMGILSKAILTTFYWKQPATMSAIELSSFTMSIYCFAAFILSITQPLTNMLQAIGKTYVPMIALAIGAVFKIGLNYYLIGLPEINIYGAIVGTISCYIVVALIDIVALLRASHTKVRFSSVFLKPLFCSLVGGAAAWAVYGMTSELLRSVPVLSNPNAYISYNSVGMAIAAVFAVAFFFATMFLTKAIEKEDVRMLPKGDKIVRILMKHGFMD